MKAVTRILAIVFMLAASTVGQTPVATRHPGFALYEQAKYSEAIRSLEIASKSAEHKTDAEIWSFLGLAYLAQDDMKKSRKAFEKSVELRPTSSIFRSRLALAYLKSGQVSKALTSSNEAIQLDAKNVNAYQIRSIANVWSKQLDPAEQDADTAIQLAPKTVEPYLLKSDVILAKLSVKVAAGSLIKDEVAFFKRAIDALQLGVSRTKEHPQFVKLQNELASMSAFYEHFSRDRTVVTPPADNVTPYKITSKPRASFTERARTASISGNVLVAVLLGANGRIEHVMLLKRLGWGLDEEAIRAARQIKFEPKKIDGKPVPVVVTVDYGFSSY